MKSRTSLTFCKVQHSFKPHRSILCPEFGVSPEKASFIQSGAIFQETHTLLGAGLQIANFSSSPKGYNTALKI